MKPKAVQKIKSGPYTLGELSMTHWEICRGNKVVEFIVRQSYMGIDGGPDDPDDPDYDEGNRPVAVRRVAYLNRKFAATRGKRSDK